MARPGITAAEVAAAAESILAEGGRPTIESVRARLGTGSPNTVLRHLSAWRAARPATQVAAVELPASLVASISAEIERAAAAARSESQADLAEARSERDELAEVGEALEGERDELAAQLLQLVGERDGLAGQVLQLTEQARTQAERIEREQVSAELARVELAKSQLKLESLVGQTGELKSQVAEYVLKIEKMQADYAAEQARSARLEAERDGLQYALDSANAQAEKSEKRTEKIEAQLLAALEGRRQGQEPPAAKKLPARKSTGAAGQ